MKVMALSQAPVLAKEGSRVMAPVCARSFEMPIPTSPSLPTVIGSSVSVPSIMSFALFVML